MVIDIFGYHSDANFNASNGINRFCYRKCLPKMAADIGHWEFNDFDRCYTRQYWKYKTLRPDSVFQFKNIWIAPSAPEICSSKIFSSFLQKLKTKIRPEYAEISMKILTWMVKILNWILGRHFVRHKWIHSNKYVGWSCGFSSNWMQIITNAL